MSIYRCCCKVLWFLTGVRSFFSTPFFHDREVANAEEYVTGKIRSSAVRKYIAQRWHPLSVVDKPNAEKRPNLYAKLKRSAVMLSLGRPVDRYPSKSRSH